MNILLCESSNKHKYNTMKARKDIREIIQGMGYRNIVLFYNNHPKPVVALEIIINSIRTLLFAQKGDNIFFQYPYYPNVVNKIIFSILHFGKKIKNYKVTMLIHDVIALRSRLRDPDAGQAALKAETLAWKWIDNIICHTVNMEKAFEKSGLDSHFLVLGPFYYLYNGEVCKREYSDTPVVMIAGNLSQEKCKYVYKLSEIENVRFDLFGTNYTGINNEHIKYRGIFDPMELIFHLDGQFGLVWDGEMIETCSGDYGKYLRYNSPHKFSLYLAAGVPIIIWKEAALAKYVEDAEIGICVNSLTELPGILENICEKKYIHMCENVMKFRENIITGNNLKEIIKKYE